MRPIEQPQFPEPMIATLRGVEDIFWLEPEEKQTMGRNDDERTKV